MNPTTPQAPVASPEPWRRTKDLAGRASGHWGSPLQGYGLAYFDRLVLEFRSTWPTTIETAEEARLSKETEAVRLAEQKRKEAEARLKEARARLKVAAEARASPPKPNGQDQELLASLDSELTAAQEELKRRETQFNEGEAELKAALDKLGETRLTVGRKIEAERTIQELIERRNSGGLLWSDLLVFEAALARLRSSTQLRMELPLLRAEYREMLGSQTPNASCPTCSRA